jgi:hypothetical protein
VEERQQLVAGVLPICIEVLCEWKRIHSVLIDSPLMANCLHLLCSQFIVRLERNLFAINVTGFALSPLRQVSIRAAEQGCETEGHVDELIP